MPGKQKQKPKQPDDGEITRNRFRAFNDKEEELKQQGKDPREAHQGASEHLAELEKTDPINYLRKKDRKAREQGAGRAEGGSANGGSERRGRAGS